MADDKFASFPPSMQDPGDQLHVATKSDTEDLPFVPRAIYIATAGTVAVHDIHGNLVNLPTMQPGWHPIRISRILNAGTSADGFLCIA